APKRETDAGREPVPAVLEAGDPRPRSCPQSVRDSSCERVEVERGEARDLLTHSAHLEARGRADRDEPGVCAREAIEVGLHQRALLVLEELDVALPDEIIGGL